MSEAKYLADRLDRMGIGAPSIKQVNDCYSAADELRRLSAIEQKYLAIMEQEPVAYVTKDKRHLLFADVVNTALWRSTLDPLYTLNKPD